MGDAMDEEDGSNASGGMSGDAAAQAAHNARMAGRLAKLRIGSSQLFLQMTEQTRMALCLADPHQPDCPLVYCNRAFLDLTGYSRDEVIGQNCRLLQGPKTKRSAAASLAEAIRSEQYTVVDILNYRKDGTSFWNAVHVGPIYDEQGALVYYFGSQWDITELLAARESIVEGDRVAAELRHRTDNLFSVLSAIVRLSARNTQDVGELTEKLERRIEALAGAPSAVYAAGRTDAGVHAIAMVAHVDIEKDFEDEVVRDAVNFHLKPAPISVLLAERVSDEFHARFSCLRRPPTGSHKNIYWVRKCPPPLPPPK